MTLYTHDAVWGSTEHDSSSTEALLHWDYKMAVQPSFESQRPLQVPITIVTAASANHLCALEAFLYDFERVMSAFPEDPDQKELRVTRRLIQNQWYLRNSDDLARLDPNYKPRKRRKPKKVPDTATTTTTSTSTIGQVAAEVAATVNSTMATETAAAVEPSMVRVAGEVAETGATAANSGTEGVEGVEAGNMGVSPEAEMDDDQPDSEESFLFAKRWQEPDSPPVPSDWTASPRRYELRPRIVVYNLGMGVHKRKRRRFKALVEAGYMDEVYDFEFWRYPGFWSLGDDELHSETRGQYGWKAGMVEEVMTRILDNIALLETASGIDKEHKNVNNGNTTNENNNTSSSSSPPSSSSPAQQRRQENHDSEEKATSSATSEEDKALDELEALDEQLVSTDDSGLPHPLHVEHSNKNTGFRVPPNGNNEDPTLVDDGALGEMPDPLSPLPSSSPTPPPRHDPHIVLWADSGDRFSPEFFRWLPSHVRRHGLWTPRSADTMARWTHPGLPEFYHKSISQFANETNCNGAVMAFDVRNSTVRDGILKEWIKCSKKRECIAPDGSSRENHRQDQSVLTFLIKIMGYGEDQCQQTPRAFGVLTNMDRYCKHDISNNPNRVVSY
ncbi:hypothetical protein BGW41_007814 [Actinomortierella wolfii]|nr:hypothetical protein BGW41_007814 [Actinomortierella wolfii]